ncbi:MAG TPA: beta-propeller domain-containing protein, partial [Polyangiales bacterium]|nr:beta-propeller domain-containing protein [Polyangiales bacterium]
MRQGRDKRGLQWLAAAMWLAAMGCQSGGGGEDPGPMQEPSGPGTDPMKIGQSELPKPDEPVEVSGLDGAEFPELNTTSFETAKDVGESSSASGVGRPSVTTPTLAGGAAPPTAGVASGNAGQADSAPQAAPGAPVNNAPMQPGAAPAAMTPSTGANPSAQREIVEADVVQAHGDILYLLNRYRGLVLVDMSNPDSPYVRGRVPFQAQPVDMYVRDGKALIVMSDYFSYWQFDGDADPLGFHGSQVLVVDVADPSHPARNGSFNVEGEVTDTRIVGDVLYAVSKRNPDYWRYDTQDWKDTSWVISIDLSDPSQIHQVDKREFPGAANLIQVYQTALSVAAIDPNYYLVDEDNAQQTKITYVDISDPKGAIRVGASAYVPGAVQDKFKMDLDKGQLRVISQNWYWRPESAATLTVFDASDATKLTQRARIDVATNTPNGVQAQATRFAGDDLFVNLCWWSVNAQQCRVDFYDLSNPSAPVKASELPVDGQITHFEVRGDRLISLGQHIQAGIGRNVQIALFDVANLRAPRRLAAVDVGGDRYGGSSALQDYKAFKVLDELEMILLPLSWVEQSQGWMSFQGAQIVDWKNDTLVARGRIAQGGYVERAIAFKNRVISISTQQVQVIDAADRDRPVETARLFLVRNVVDVYSIRGHAVQLAASERDGGYRFFVLPFGEDDMAKSVAELTVDFNLMYQIRSGDLVYVIGSEKNTGAQLIRAADFSNPMQPRWRGEYRVADDIQHIYGGGYGGYWSFYD